MPHPAGQRTTPRHLTLELAFPPLAADLDGVAVHVRIEDVGEADAPARLLLQRDFRLVRVSRDARKAALEIDIPDLGNVALPAIRVHVDLSGAGASSAKTTSQRIGFRIAGAHRCLWAYHVTAVDDV